MCAHINLERQSCYELNYKLVSLQHLYVRLFACHVGTEPAMASSLTKGAMSIVNQTMPLNLHKYKRFVATLKESDALTLEEFKQSNWANYFVNDIMYTF